MSKTAITLSVAAVVVGLFVAAVLSRLLDEVASRVDKARTEFKEKVGDKVVIDGDTATVIDYDFMNSTLKLSSGVDVSIQYYEDNKVDDHD